MDRAILALGVSPGLLITGDRFLFADGGPLAVNPSVADVIHCCRRQGLCGVTSAENPDFGLIFDIVLGRAAGTVTALGLAAVVIVLWVVLPRLIRRRHLRHAAG